MEKICKMKYLMILSYKKNSSNEEFFVLFFENQIKMFLTLIRNKNVFFVFGHQPANTLKEERPLIFICLQLLQETCTLKFHTLRFNHLTIPLYDIGGVEPPIVVDLCYFNQILILYPITRIQPRNSLFGISFVVQLPN